VPFIFYDFPDTVCHAAILFASPLDLELKTSFYHVERVHDEDFGDASNRPCGELVLEWKGYNQLKHELEWHVLHLVLTLW
jgi:hypothetical protein